MYASPEHESDVPSTHRPHHLAPSHISLKTNRSQEVRAESRKTTVTYGESFETEILLQRDRGSDPSEPSDRTQ